MSQSNNVRLTQRLYQLIINNLAVLLVIMLLGFAIWIFGYLNNTISEKDRYRPVSREEALAYVLNHIVPVDKITPAIAGNKGNAFLSFGDDTCLSISDGSITKERITKINSNLNTLYAERFIKNPYQLDTKALVADFCGASVSENDLKFAIKLLTNKDRLMQLNWAERTGSSNTQQGGYVTVPVNWLAQTNPWFGLPGCVYVHSAKAENGISYLSRNNNDTIDALCNHPQILPPQLVKKPKEQDIPSSDELELSLPKDLFQMYSGLHNLQSSRFDKELVEAYEGYHKKYDDRNVFSKLFASPINTIDIDGADVKIGYNIDLTIDTDVQAMAQQITDCMTVDTSDGNCNSILSSQMIVDANTMYENSLVRSIGVAVLDVDSQKILALASSHSDCYAYDNGDDINPKNCPKLWKRNWDGYNLLNHAVFQYAPPGSIIKPVQALSIVRSGDAYQDKQSEQYKYLQRVMASSSTKRVADYLLCKQTASDYIVSRDVNGLCPTIPAFQQSALDMGWSVNCKKDSANGNCGFKDLLFGLPYNAEPMIQSRYFSGRLLTDSKKNYNISDIAPKLVNSCVTANGGVMRGSCKAGGDQINAYMNEVFGAGNAQSSALGAAEMFATLLSADNGNTQRRGAHIIDNLWGVDQILLRPRAWRGDAKYGNYENLAQQPINITKKEANSTLGLFYGTLKAGAGLPAGEQFYKNGTAVKSCQQAIGDCGWMANKVVAKTGTPGFNYTLKEGATNNVTVNMINRRCYGSDASHADCKKHPYKWFIMGLPDESGKWDKAVAILVERNWKKSGMVDDPEDSVNRAAQAGSLIAQSLLQSLSTIDQQ